MTHINEQEIKEIVRVIIGIGRHGDENETGFDEQLKTVNEIFELFNKKYPRLSLILENDIQGLQTKILINENSVKKVFDEVASRLKGFTGIGLGGFDEASVQEGDAFAQLASQISNKVNLTFTLDTGSETMVLEFNEKYKKVELNYDAESLGNPMTPQFQLFLNYLNEVSDPNIDILNKCYTLGFFDIEDEALFKWEDDFFPKMLE